MQLGYNTAGTEQVFEQMLNNAIKKADGPFTYLEIGVAEGTTLGSVARFLSEHRTNWNAIGVDILDGPFFNAQRFLRENSKMNTEILFNGDRQVQLVPQNMTNIISIVLMGDGDTLDGLLIPTESLHFVLIDGCHGAPCVERDFLAIENLVAPGGIVAFHDAMPEDQGRDWQEHCQQMISVRQALNNLAMPLPNSVGFLADWKPRPGWEFAGEVHGDKSVNPPGNGFAFFRKL